MKKLKDWRVTQYLQDHAPDVLEVVGDVAGLVSPPVGRLVKAIGGSPSMTEAEKNHALELLEYDIVEQQEITKRLESDNNSDNVFAKTVRPLTLWAVTCMMFVLTVCDSYKFMEVKDVWISSYTQVWLAMIAFYFGGRTLQKTVGDKGFQNIKLFSRK